MEPMRVEAAALVGTHDYRAFRGSADAREDTTRTLTSVRLEAHGPFLDVVVEGDRFLYHMVRIIVGTLVDVGRGRLATGAVSRALTSGDRRALGVTAPPDGLCLEHIELEPFANSELELWPALPQPW
jgi:tRNA pseudouridine38-40 synthase